jgi:hypothetical protein
MEKPGFSPAAEHSAARDSARGPAAPDAEQDAAIDDAGSPPLEPGETVIAETIGVVLGWQPRTVLIWWVPGLIFIALAWLQFRSLFVVAGLTLFCAALFAFYASDREVRPRSSRKRYLLTQRRLLIAAAGSPAAWRLVGLNGIVATQMESGLADRIVMRLSSAATIVLEMREMGPKGEPRRMRIGPMRSPEAFRAAIDAQL